ncbi:MAG: DinB family protein [Pirellulaceae bacterium]
MSMVPVLHSFAYCLDFLCEQVADVAASDMVAQPNGIMNHPSWVVGHLTYSCQAMGGEIGLPDWLPNAWAKRFGRGSTPVADTALYEKKDDAIHLLRDAQSRIVTAVQQLDDSQLDQPLPDENFRTILPTIRHALTQVLVAHPANHIGQLTMWRQAMGLPRLTRPFV